MRGSVESPGTLTPLSVLLVRCHRLPVNPGYTSGVRFLLSDIAAAVGGEMVGSDDPTLTATSIDSRDIASGSLFVPIVAERDGHEFIDGAVQSGAAAHLTSDPARVSGPAVLVADTGKALLRLGHAARQRLPDRVVGITGSVGKTSVKDLVASAIGAGAKAHANVASFNNELGLPLTLANAPDDVEVVVVEMGARGIGHITTLCDIAEPTVGIVTRVAEAHTELFGSIEGVAQGKGELIEALPSSGTAILNADDERVAAMASRASCRVMTFGQDAGDIRVASLELDELLRPSFVLETPLGSRAVHLQVAGAHMAVNAAAAVAAGLAVGLDLDTTLLGLENAVLSSHRMQMVSLATGATVINDAYNANPTSMRAGMASLLSLPTATKTMVVGVMAELGDGGDDAHLEIAAEAATAGIRVIAVDAPVYGSEVEHVADIAGAQAALGSLGPDDGVLIKGSRVAELERLVAVLSA